MSVNLLMQTGQGSEQDWWFRVGLGFCFENWMVDRTWKLDWVRACRKCGGGAKSMNWAWAAWCWKPLISDHIAPLWAIRARQRERYDFTAKNNLTDIKPRYKLTDLLTIVFMFLPFSVSSPDPVWSWVLSNSACTASLEQGTEDLTFSLHRHHIMCLFHSRNVDLLWQCTAHRMHMLNHALRV